MKLAAGLAVFLSLCALDGSSARAQAPGQAGPAQVVSAEPIRRWSLGVHAGGMGLESKANPERRTELGGIGVHLRYQFADRWAADLAATHMQGELAEPSMLDRHTGSLTLGLAFFFNPDASWRWSALLQLGGSRDTIVKREDPSDIQAEFAGGQARLGVGLERRFDRWSFGGQLLAVATSRNDEELDGPAFIGMDEPVPAEASGGLLQLTASYSF